MNALSQDARALIESVSKLDGPSATDKLRVQQRLSLQLGAAAFSTVVLTSAAEGADQVLQVAMKAPKLGLLSSAGKLLLSVCAVGALAGTLLIAGSEHGARKQSAQPKLAPPVQAPAAQLAQKLGPPLERLETPQTTALTTDTPLTGAARLRARSTEPAAATTKAASTLSAELALLAEAQAALRAGQPAKALQLAEQHQARFPEGVMKEERMGIAALSECTLGDADLRRAQAFLKLLPNSPLAARLRKTCGLE